MLFAGALVLSWSALPAVLAQLSLPEPPYTPPDASSGVQASTGSSSNTQWSNLLGNLLYFYDEQRSGKLPSSERVSWRNDSALDDGSDVNLDLSGGYYDAGGTLRRACKIFHTCLTFADYVKYTFPLSFSLMSICWGALDAGQGPLHVLPRN